MVGKTLGHYEVLEPLGAGGMGEVYRAHDTTLKRDVAIKVLPEDLSADVGRLARLEREAHLLASLNHPGIAAIHSLEEADEVRFLVLELVQGNTLAERLGTGPLDVEEALELARQMAEALEAAHDSGIIHRDLKPSNIMLTAEGKVKVLDFGLAKAFEAEGEAPEGDLSHSPTATVDGTRTGVILGTAAYMSPEQARGKPLDERTDIWSFGCVLYEMLTSRRPFVGEDVSETMAAILKDKPDWSALPASTPVTARALLRRCLRKDPDRRLHDIADARIEIEEAVSEPEGGLPGLAPVAVQLPLWRRAIPWGLAGIAVTSLGLWILMSGTAPTTEIVRSVIPVEAGHRLWGGYPRELRTNFIRQRPSRTAIAFSPDGRHLVYAATDGEESRLYLRPLGQRQATRLRGTEGGCCPFFSADGQSIGFFARDEEGWSMKSVHLSGGDARTIVPQVQRPYGASWGDDGTVVFADGVEGGLLRVSAAGGTPEPLTEVDWENGETGHRLPHLLPGSNAVLFTVMRGHSRWGDAEIFVKSVESSERPVLIEAGADARYVPTGHLVFAREGTLIRVPFDPVRLETTGEPVPVLEDVMQAAYVGDDVVDTGAAQFTLSASGSLAYAPGGVYPESARQLLWVDREGESEVIPIGVGGFWLPRISQDGRYLAYLKGRISELDLWVYDTQSGASPRRLTLEGGNNAIVWSPDGERIVLASTKDGSVYNLYALAADGTSPEPERLTQSDREQRPSSWSRDGVLAFVEGENDIRMLPMEGEHAGEAKLFFESTSVEQYPAFSPNGKWLAYTSNETERMEVYVRPYPGPGAAIPISTDGGRRVAWSQDGRELFYRETSGRMMVVDVDVAADGTFAPGRPRLLFEKSSVLATYPTRSFDVAPDGRFLMASLSPPEPQPVTQINIILNWFEELKRLVPTGR